MSTYFEPSKTIVSKVKIEENNQTTNPNKYNNDKEFDYQREVRYHNVDQGTIFLNTWRAANGQSGTNLDYKIMINDDLTGKHGHGATSNDCCLIDSNNLCRKLGTIEVINDVVASVAVQPPAPPKIIYKEERKEIPAQIIFNPQKNDKGEYFASESKEGVFQRLNALTKSKVAINAPVKTLIFSSSYNLNRIDPIDNNKISPLHKAAVIDGSKKCEF